MKRVAILGGGIAGLAAAYESQQQGLDWHLYEAGDRLGGTVATTTLQDAHGTWVLEGGPDAWVTDKPWAHELATELGLAGEIIVSDDDAKRTYVAFADAASTSAQRHLVAMPRRMRMMVPEDLATLDESPLFTDAAKHAYADELKRADELKKASPFADEAYDESVAAFVRRHFGDEVLAKIGAPLLSGVFGGDTEQLSVRAVMAPFVRMEQEHGSLIAALEARAAEKAARGEATHSPTFTTLRRGMGSLVDAIVAALPADRLHLHSAAAELRHAHGGWQVRFTGRDAHSCAIGFVPFDAVLCAVPVDAARALLGPVDAEAAALIPTDASSAVLATFCWPAETAATFDVPPGFGFLVPQTYGDEHGFQTPVATPHLLAATFTAQKFADRAPAGARVVRVFFGTGSAEAFAGTPDAQIAALALTQLQQLIGALPAPDAARTTVHRWPRSLPQYAVGHPARMRALDARLAALPGLALLGNGYRGVGVPDLIRDARDAARAAAHIG